MDRVEFLIAKERERGKEMDKKIVQLQALSDDLGEKAELMKTTHAELTETVDSKLVEWDAAFDDRFLTLE